VPRVYELAAETLARLGHRTVFGLLGSGNFKLVEHLVSRCDGRLVWVRHESAAVAAADAYAQVTRGLGVATVHQGPGVTNTLTSLTNAVRERTPLLLLAGQTARGRQVNQTLDLAALATALGAGVEEVRDGSSVVEDVGRAVARAQRERLPIVLGLPIDLQEEEVSGAASRSDTVASGGPSPQRPSSADIATAADPARGPSSADIAAPADPPRPPSSADIAAAADLIAASERPLIIAGRGAVLADARAPLEALGDRIGALFATSLVGNGLFAGNPRSLGVCGGFASRLAERVVPQADLVLAFGAGLNQWTTMHRTLVANADVVQCDIEPDALGRHGPVRLGLLGDAAATAAALLAELERRGHAAGGFRDSDAERELLGYSAADDYEEVRADGLLDPRSLTVALDRLLPAERTVVYDGGHFHWFPTPFLSVPDADGFVPAQGFQSVGLGLGTAIGAATARPDRPVLLLIGDGGTMMTLGELDSLVAQRLAVAVAIFDDGAYGAEVHHFGPMGMPTDLVEFGDRDFAAIARALGARAATIRATEELAGAVEPWLAARDGPLVLDCKVNPRVAAERLPEAFKGGA
jgi:thiamine pyrophosphate-dependent acetolactate synthase large subunit-like protein